MRSRLVLFLLTAVLCVAEAGGAQTLRVVATTPDLGSIARSVARDVANVTVLVKGPQDPHFIEPRPSLVRVLHDADLLVVVGLELEIGWLPTLLRGARNPEVRPGGTGYVDASRVITPLDVPRGEVDRSMGDVHTLGNPHYLSDPINGLRVAALLRDRFSEARPAHTALFEARYLAFASELAMRLLGEPSAGEGDPEARVRAAERGAAQARGGWLANLRPADGPLAVEDHRFWAYFARRFGIELVGELEPHPGIAPTTRHLGEIVAVVRAREVPLILSTAYFDRDHAEWVAERTGARVVALAHQPGAREGTDDYLTTVDYNVRQVAEALAPDAP